MITPTRINLSDLSYQLGTLDMLNSHDTRPDRGVPGGRASETDSKLAQNSLPSYESTEPLRNDCTAKRSLDEFRGSSSRNNLDSGDWQRHSLHMFSQLSLNEHSLDGNGFETSLIRPTYPRINPSQPTSLVGNLNLDAKYSSILNMSNSFRPSRRQAGSRSLGNYSEVDLDRLFAFLRAYRLADPSVSELLDKLGSQNKALLCGYLQKVYELRLRPDPEVGSEVLLGRLQGLSVKRSNEQRIKLVYSQVLKALEKGFYYGSAKFVRAHAQPRFEDFVADKKSTFYLYLFRETILGGRVHEDLLMDVLYERATVKSPCINRYNNWRSVRKPRAMKKISAATRYLIQQDHAARRRVLEFMDYTDGTGLISSLRRDIADKLKKKQRFWLEILAQCGHLFDEFEKVFLTRMDSKKYKNPWTIPDVKSAIDHAWLSWWTLTTLSSELRSSQSKLGTTPVSDSE